MKKPKQFAEGKKATEAFERTMAALFRIQKSAVAEKIKAKKKKGKWSW